MGSPSWGKGPVSSHGTMRSGSSTAARAPARLQCDDLRVELRVQRGLEVCDPLDIRQHDAQKCPRDLQGVAVTDVLVPLAQGLDRAEHRAGVGIVETNGPLSVRSSV